MYLVFFYDFKYVCFELVRFIAVHFKTATNLTNHGSNLSRFAPHASDFSTFVAAPTFPSDCPSIPVATVTCRCKASRTPRNQEVLAGCFRLMMKPLCVLKSTVVVSVGDQHSLLVTVSGGRTPSQTVLAGGN